MWPCHLLLLALGSSYSLASITGPVATDNFPDPSVIQASDGTWYSFATTNGAQNVPVATSPDFVTWTVSGQDALPAVGAWSNGQNVWAPDMVEIDSTYVLYYAATVSDGSTHCIGAATASSPQGPYTAAATAIACPTSQGGAIDPAGFKDANGDRYVVYKIDGNSIGHGGNCNNGVAPLLSTPIMIQPMEADGVTPRGAPTQILDRSAEDGPLVEAPSLILFNGVYILFYSRNCYSGPNYAVAYATSTSLFGTYTKAANPLISTGYYGDLYLYAPGGASVAPDGSRIVFHADLGDNSTTRQMHTGLLSIGNTIVSI